MFGVHVNSSQNSQYTSWQVGMIREVSALHPQSLRTSLLFTLKFVLTFLLNGLNYPCSFLQARVRNALRREGIKFPTLSTLAILLFQKQWSVKGAGSAVSGHGLRLWVLGPCLLSHPSWWQLWKWRRDGNCCCAWPSLDCSPFLGRNVH